MRPRGHPKIVNRDHTGMGEACGCARFPPEALRNLGVAHQIVADQLDRHAPVERGIQRLINCTHPATPQAPFQAITFRQEAWYRHGVEASALFGALF